ncbi:MAG: pyridoxamine 5'-phosphate oxidase [bacterium]|nr:pyridoxamine 5'-phosphate oxidase [bacterium]
MADPIKISELRKDYKFKALLESDVLTDPIEQFKVWFDEAMQAQLPEPNAMCLSTIQHNQPSSRYVLLKGIEHQGFVFFSNYNSNKGSEMEAIPNVALNFIWLELERQVRVEGTVSKLTDAENDDYFYSRPIGSQIGAIVSAQSSVLKDRKELDDAWTAIEGKYHTEKPIRPEHWGGYLVKPNKIEFWQGRSSRLHDRLLFTLNEGKWELCRLSP